MRITLLTVGSRGDIQPYVALGIGLKAAGHEVCVATETNYQALVTSHELEFAALPGNRQEWLSQEEWQELLGNTDSIFQSSKAATEKLTLPTLPAQLAATWKVCQGTDAIISMPWVFGSYHVAQKLGVPFYAAWTNPSTRTREFPHSWVRLPQQRWLGGSVNLCSYLLSEWLYWQSVGKPLNAWRKEFLELPEIVPLRDGNLMQPVPYLYAYSPTVVPKPSDWADWVNPTGYWFLERPADWQPAPELVDFLAAGAPPVYVGFGSLSDRNPAETTEIVIQALQKTGQRAILDMGWNSLVGVDLPDTIFPVESDQAPHDWLLPQVSAVIHRGGSGTTGAALRAGKPNIVIYLPFTDYFFWGQQVAHLGAGPAPIIRDKLTVDGLATAIQLALSCDRIKARAAEIGAQIRAENGVQRAVEAFHQHLPTPLKQAVLHA